MDKEELEKELNIDRKKTPYVPKDEVEAKALADYAVSRNYDDPDEILSSPYLISEFLTQQYGKKFELEEKDKEMQKELRAKEQLQRLSGLTDLKRIEELKSGIENEEYTEKMKVALGMSEKVDKDRIRQKVQEYNEKLKEDETIEKEAQEEANKIWQGGLGEAFKRKLAELKENVE